MEYFDREFIKRDSVFSKLHDLLKAGHEPAEHTKKNLIANRHKPNFCEVSRHFVVISNKTPLYLHFDASSWLVDDRILVRIDGIAVYHDFIEYETERVKQLYGTDEATIPSLN